MNRAATLALTPLSGLYGAVVRTGNALYRRGIFQTERVAAPVISVGNLTTGGTGKTPLVEWIARELAQMGRRVCVLTRGYRRETSGRILVSDAETVLVDVNQAGDEAFLLAEQLIGTAAVICDADRVAAAHWAIENLKRDAFILDDGFQHQRIVRDLNILVIDATNPWGNGHLLPAGILREPRTALSRADCIVITRADDSDRVEELQSEIAAVKKGLPVFRAAMELTALRRLDQGATVDVDKLKELPVAAFCAVGNPQSFFSLLRRNGFRLDYTQIFHDHHKYTQADIDRVARGAQAHGAQAMFTTAKDAVKIRSLNFALPCYVVEIAIAVDRGAELRQQISKAIESA